MAADDAIIATTADEVAIFPSLVNISHPFETNCELLHNGN
jgi:hypothetical protein